MTSRAIRPGALRQYGFHAFCRIILCAVCLTGVSSALASGENADPVAQAGQLIKHGRLDQALELLTPLASIDPEPRGAEYLRGLVLYQQGKLQEAAAAFARAVAQDQGDLEAMKMEGASLFRLGRAADAIPFLEKAQKTTLEMNVDPQYVLGLCYMDTSRYDDARHAFAIQYDFPPDSASAYLLEAKMLLRRQYLPAAEKTARKALELKPDLPSAHLLLGQIALAQGNAAEAVAQFLAERNLDPMSGAVYERLGDAYIRIGDYTNARKSLDRAVLLEPTLNIPYILLGKVLLEQDEALMATVYLKHALDIDAKNYMAHALLGRAYRSLGRTEDSVAELRTAEKLQETDPPSTDTSR